MDCGTLCNKRARFHALVSLSVHCQEILALQYLNKHGAAFFKWKLSFLLKMQQGSRLTWPKEFLYQAKEEKGCGFGSKSAILEADRLLIPLIAFLDFVAGKKGHFFNSKLPTWEAVRLLIPLVTFPIFIAGKRVLFRVDKHRSQGGIAKQL